MDNKEQLASSVSSLSVLKVFSANSRITSTSIICVMHLLCMTYINFVESDITVKNKFEDYISTCDNIINFHSPGTITANCSRNVDCYSAVDNSNCTQGQCICNSGYAVSSSLTNCTLSNYLNIYSSFTTLY